jgi:hypothetical protein
MANQPIRLPGLKPGVCSGLILSGAIYPDLKIGVWRRRTYQSNKPVAKGVSYFLAHVPSMQYWLRRGDEK